MLAALRHGVSAAAQDILTDFNTPEGDCPICLLPFASVANAAEQLPVAAEQPVKLPCYHCLHGCAPVSLACRASAIACMCRKQRAALHLQPALHC